jgi:hypothetical protein
MWSILSLLFLFGIFQVNGQMRPSGSAPVVTSENFNPSTPASSGGTVGTVSATNSPTSWSITAGNTAGDFAISNSGVITFTSQGATDYNGCFAQKSATLTVQATNTSGSGTGIVDINAYADGSVDAPSGSAQYPSGLSGYSVRPPWKVAGFDYYVGIASGMTLSSPTTISNPNVTVSGGEVRCVGSGASVTLNAIDFTGYYIYVPSGGCSSITVTNSNFACTGGRSPSYAFFSDHNNATELFKYNKINSGDNCGTFPNNVSDPIACGGNCTVEYNWFYHAAERVVDAGIVTLYQWNLIDSPNTQHGAHENYQQFSGGTTYTSDVVQFNASYNGLSQDGAEGYQFYGNVDPTIIEGPVMAYNTMIALKTSRGSSTMSYMVHGSCHVPGSGCTAISGTGVVANNYFDPTGAAYGIFYPGTLTAALRWSSSNNIDMVTGRVVTPQ